MIKLTLGIGQTATFKYGDVGNSDARHISEMPMLFDMLRKVFGINFMLDDDGNECYTLHRMEDLEHSPESILKIDNHMADEILFTAISLWSLGKQIPKISIETPVSRDYHIGAMVKFGKVIGMIPGMGGMQETLAGADLEKDINRLFGIIDSMTPEERRNPSRVIDQTRRRRIATGAGVQPQEVNDLVKQFDGMASMMKGMAGLGMKDRMREVQKMQSAMGNPAGRLGRPKGDTGKRLTAEQRRKLKKQREKEARRRKRDARR